MTVPVTGPSQRVWEQPYQSFDIGVQGECGASVAAVMAAGHQCYS